MYLQRLVAHPDRQRPASVRAGDRGGSVWTRVAPALRYFAGTRLPAEEVDLVPMDLPDDRAAAHRLVAPGAVA